MLNSLLINTALLVSFLHFSSQLFTAQPISTKNRLLTIAAAGTLFGANGCMLMFNGIQFPSPTDFVLLDFRAFASMFAIIFCGPLAGLICSAIIILFRVSYFGITTGTLVSIANQLVLLIIFCALHISRLPFLAKYISMTLAHIATSILIILFLLPPAAPVGTMLRTYILLAAAAAAVLYIVLIYIFRTNDMYVRLQRESTRDSLTGLYNVRAFDQFLNASISAATEKDSPLSLLMIDIDFFKKINDTYGHTSGDLVLKQLSNILTVSCRGHDFVSRNGGEEFTAILVDCDVSTACYIAERIRKNVEIADFALGDHQTINITVSIGVSTYPANTSSPHELLQRADDALYLAKRSGRNLVKCAGEIPASVLS